MKEIDILGEEIFKNNENNSFLSRSIISAENQFHSVNNE